MRLVLLTHPPLLNSESMPRFAGMIMRGMQERGHQAEFWTSTPGFSRLPVKSTFVRKWLGYVDQFLIYPRTLRQQVKRQPADTLFVVTDQALGMWVPQFVDRPHVIHCHDFLALRSSLGEFPENPTGWTGKQYQRLIRNGFARGKVFISVSQKTQDDLHGYLPNTPRISEVVPNGLNHAFRPMEIAERTALLKKTGTEFSERGFIIHVGGNLWYKNRMGVLKIYQAYVASTADPLPLWMLGSTPTPEMVDLANSIPAPGKVWFLAGLSNEQVNAAYSHARVLLFPSLEEGFGWPIAEAMASNCPVITTDRAPMSEVAGGAARLIPRTPTDSSAQEAWAKSAAIVLNEVARCDGDERKNLLERGQANVARFDTAAALASYEKIYSRAMTFK